MGGSSTVSNATCVVGVDFGTLSGRALVVRVSDGAELGTATHEYRHGVLEDALPSGRRLPPDWALQHPGDYIDVLKSAVPAAMAAAGVSPADIVGLATDFTACTVLPTKGDGTPLCLTAEFADEPHAWVKLWKHHAAQGQADRINELARKRGEPWLTRYGGKISAEWQFAKALQVLEEAPRVYAATDRWIEAADWIIWQLCGNETRNACTAGYKGIFQDGNYPSAEYLAELNPGFESFVTDKLEFPLSPLGGRAGSLTEEAASWTGLPAGIAVAVGNVDAHVTAPAAQAVEPGQLVAIMGTSTCHVVNGDTLADVPGMCGVVDGGIIDGFFGYEAGQSGVGDIFAWLADDIVGAKVGPAASAAGQNVHEYLSALASNQEVGQHGLLALDWVNGNRSVLVDAELSGVIVGLTMATAPEDIYRALVEATAFGTRLILASFEGAGVAISEFIAAGGLIKNSFVMQVYADVLARPISVIDTDQGPALGSAIHAAVAAGEYADVPSAAAVMGKKRSRVFVPNLAVTATYDLLYAEYVRLHDYFGRGENDVLHRLRAIRNAHR
jgi:L-ribulokinase